MRSFVVTVTTLVVFLGVLLGASRARAADASLAETKLPNGLRVVLDENHRVPLVSVTVRYHVGAGDDPDDRNGLTELVMRMMARRTEHVADDGITDAFDRVGGTWSWDSTVDDSDVYATVPSNAIETAFWIFSDQMGFFKPAIDAAAMTRAVQAIADDRGTRVANAPLGLVDELVPEELYPAHHPYRHVPRADDAVLLKQLVPADVGAFVDRYFVPSNAVLVVVGDAKLDQVTALANKWFGAIPAGSPRADSSVQIPSLQHEIHLEVAARVERPMVRITWVTPAEYAPGDAELDVVADILHGNRITRLSWELITRLRIAGEIHTRQLSHERASTFTITAVATPKHTPQELQKAIDDVLVKLQTTEPPDADDLQGALASTLADRTLSMEGSEYRARQLAKWMLHTGTADYWQTDMRRYELDPARVQAAAQRLLPTGRRVVTYITPSATAPVSGKLVGRTVQ